MTTTNTINSTDVLLAYLLFTDALIARLRCDQCGERAKTTAYTKSEYINLELCSSCTPALEIIPELDTRDRVYDREQEEKLNLELEASFLHLLAWPSPAMLAESLRVGVQG